MLTFMVIEVPSAVSHLLDWTSHYCCASVGEFPPEAAVEGTEGCVLVLLLSSKHLTTA